MFKLFVTFGSTKLEHLAIVSYKLNTVARIKRARTEAAPFDSHGCSLREMIMDYFLNG